MAKQKVTIIQTLLTYGANTFHFKDIAHDASLPVPSTQAAMSKLKIQGFLRSHGSGVYSVQNREGLKALLNGVSTNPPTAPAANNRSVEDVISAFEWLVYEYIPQLERDIADCKSWLSRLGSLGNAVADIKQRNEDERS